MVVNKARLASELLGGGGLEKLQITTYDKHGHRGTEPIEALFNPREISRSRSVTWHPRRIASQGGSWTWSDMGQRFGSVGAETLSIELFFDTYESPSPSGTWTQAAASLLSPVSPFQTSDA